jgi:hypothetical protein
MADLQLCYFCGSGPDGSLGEYSVVPPDLDPSPEQQQSVVLCRDCREKLTTVMQPVVEAATEYADSGDTTGSRDQQPGAGAGSENQQPGGGSRDQQPGADTGGSRASSGPDEPSAGDGQAGAEGQPGGAGGQPGGAGGQPGGAGGQQGHEGGQQGSGPGAAPSGGQGGGGLGDVADDDPSGSSSTDDQGAGGDSWGGSEFQPGAPDGAGGEDPAESTPGSGPADGSTSGGSASGGSTSGGSASGGGTDSGGPPPESNAKRDQPHADDELVGRNNEAYNKTLRLLQNREFPVERHEIEQVAANAYQLDPQEVSNAIDALINKGLLSQEGAQLIRA